jgi:hypothetical protein
MPDIQFQRLEELILIIRNQKVLLDIDVAQIYCVTTKDVNRAVANNPNKFPEGYIFQLSKIEKKELEENFNRFKNLKNLKHSTVNPKAFTERGLYMLATILKSPQSVQATLSIIETFSKLRELSRDIRALSLVKNETEQKSLLQRSGEIMADLLEDGLESSGSETSFELNLALVKFKHIVKKEKTR